MQFARTTFSVAGCWGILSLTPLFFAYHFVGQKNPPAITHPEYYFGFLCVAFAWQIAFLVIGRDPSRFRTLMVPAFIEKFGYAGACLLLASLRMVVASTVVFAIVDFCIGALFVISWLKCASSLEVAS